MRLIDADELIINEHESYLRAQIISVKGIDKLLSHRVDEIVHNKIQHLIADTPTVEAEPVVYGHWIMKKTATGAEYTVCSHCNTSVKYKDEYGMVVMNLKDANYCPKCGAKNG